MYCKLYIIKKNFFHHFNESVLFTKIPLSKCDHKIKSNDQLFETIVTVKNLKNIRLKSSFKRQQSYVSNDFLFLINTF